MTFQQLGQTNQTPSPPPESGVSRPRGTRILMLVDLVVGILVAISGIQNFASSVDPQIGSSLWYTSGVIFLILGLLLVVLGYGLWRARPWAWPLGLWAGVVYVVLGVFALDPLFLLVGIGSLLFYYFNREDLKRYLGKVRP